MKTDAHQIALAEVIKSRTFVRKVFFKDTAIAIVSILLCAAGLAVAGETNNGASTDLAKSLVQNGGFENLNAGDRGTGGWNLKSALFSQEQMHEGKTSLKLPVQADDENKQIEAQQFMDVSLFKAGDEVEFSLYVMSTAKLGPGSHPYARIIFTDSDHKQQAGAIVSLPSEASSEWKQLSKKLTIPVDFPPNGRVVIQIILWIGAKPDSVGAIYVDDVQVITPTTAK